jgi:hypothetical protein
LGWNPGEDDFNAEALRSRGEEERKISDAMRDGLAQVFSFSDKACNMELGT